MSELNQTATESVAKPQPAKPPSLKPKLERVASLKPCEIPQPMDGGDILYQMCYVTMTGKQVYKPCTKAVYNKITGQKLDYKKKSDFVLTFERLQTPLAGHPDWVTHIVEQPKPDLMPGFKKEEEKKEQSNALVLRLSQDGAVTPINVPERVTTEAIEAISDAVREAESELLPGSVLAKHYSVLERREVVGATDIYVDPMPRER